MDRNKASQIVRYMSSRSHLKEQKDAVLELFSHFVEYFDLKDEDLRRFASECGFNFAWYCVSDE